MLCQLRGLHILLARDSQLRGLSSFAGIRHSFISSQVSASQSIVDMIIVGTVYGHTGDWRLMEETVGRRPVILEFLKLLAC